MQQKKLNVAAYCRVSTDKDDQANSLASQQQFFEEYIQKNPEWNLVEIYYDEGISGTSTRKRGAFNRMIADAKNGRIDYIFTKEVSRFARNTVDTLQITRDLKAIRVGVLFVNDNIDTLEKDGELRLSIMATIAQEESRKTSERVKWGQKRRMEQGVVFGNDLLGYRVKNGKLEIVPEEAEIVRMIFHKYLHEGKGTSTIANELREAGIPTIKGNLWSNTVLLRVLRNEKYVGDLLQKKTYTPDYLTHTKKYNNGTEDKVYIHQHHEAIIDRETWDATQQELERRSSGKHTKHSNRYWCSGKLICGECGCPMVSRKKNLKHAGTRKAWICASATRHGVAKLDQMGNEVGCDNGSVNEKVLVAAVRYVLFMLQSDKDALVQEIMKDIRSVQSEVPTVDVELIQKHIADIEKKKVKAIDLMIEGVITKEDLRVQKERYDIEIEQEKKKLQANEQIQKELEQQKEDLVGYVQELERMMRFDVDSEEIYKETVEKITLYKNHSLEIKLKGLPFYVKLNYETAGKMEQYAVTFTLVEIYTEEGTSDIYKN